MNRHTRSVKGANASRVRGLARIGQLSEGALVILVGLRAQLEGRHTAPNARIALRAALREDAAAAETGLKSLTESLATDGARGVIALHPADPEVSGDELAIINAIAAAQDGQTQLRDMRLTWLSTARPSPQTTAAIDLIAAVLLAHDLPALISAPRLTQRTPPNLGPALRSV